jgi:hypothetical protein
MPQLFTTYPEWDFLLNIGFAGLLQSYLTTNILHLRVVLAVSSLLLALWNILGACRSPASACAAVSIQESAE